MRNDDDGNGEEGQNFATCSSFPVSRSLLPVSDCHKLICRKTQNLLRKVREGEADKRQKEERREGRDTEQKLKSDSHSERERDSERQSGSSFVSIFECICKNFVFYFDDS